MLEVVVSSLWNSWSSRNEKSSGRNSRSMDDTETPSTLGRASAATIPCTSSCVMTFVPEILMRIWRRTV